MTLNAQQRNELRNILELRYNRLLSELEADRAKAVASISLAEGRRGEADERPAAMQEAGVANAELSRDRHELEAVQQALARFDSGDYGTCVACGRRIPWARLQIAPAAARCLDCQQSHERLAAS
ncbi:MAG TPA: TraR/DksA C4-type zinc finger protein [Ramlibacter sp.]|uniref:TraR/DksA family transcriptional regulator n=1 Tax=Ramlibacter sp. TaxID=1917967 RepID=UPI002ED3272A